MTDETPATVVDTGTEADGEEYVFPLSFQQTQFWFLEQLAAGGPTYHMPVVLRLRGPVRLDLLTAALGHVVDRHEVLRTRYQPDEQVQIVAERWRPEVELVDLTDVRADRRAARERDAVREVVRRPFDLWAAPPVRVALVRTAAEEHVLVVVVHHIACDGWSLGVLAGELSVAYTALHAGTVPDLPALSIQYGDFALWQRDRLTDDVLADELAHWSAALTGAPAALDLPTDRPRPDTPALVGGRVRHHVPAELTERVTRRARAAGASFYMAVLAAYATVLARVAGQDVVVVGTAIAGRTRPETNDLVGCFIDVVPLCLDVTGDPTAAELIGRAKAVCLAAYAHQELPFERLVAHLRPARDPARPPVFQVMLNAQDTPRRPVRWPEVEVTVEDAEPGVAKYDLTVDLRQGGDGAVLDVEFAADVLVSSTVERLMARVSTVLTWLAADDGTRLSDVDIRPPEEVEWVQEASDRAGVRILDANRRDLPAGAVGDLCGPDLVPSGQRARFRHDGTVELVEECAAEAPAPPPQARDELVDLVLEHVRTILRRPDVTPTDDFFDAGGGSVSAMRLLLDIERSTGHRLDIRDMFRDATPAGLAARVRAARGPHPDADPAAGHLWEETR
jgi:hypothetical protein